ncbi:MAG: DNA translocase FtsK 4TM domain-containing protein, partial [Rikenellaceae bacterium]|nr:DNA translocase FtsK 4TM domain-containing protein [Rikenellaceae bacterium]
MAKQDTSKKKKREFKLRFTLTDQQRWVVGVIVLFVGLYLAYSTIAYMFTWKANQTFIQYGDFLPSDSNVVGGSLSAWLGNLLVGKGFGVFGVVAPVAIIFAALRIMRRLPARLERAARISLLVMILGSITIGAIAGKNGAFGCGLGGVLGTFSAEWLLDLLGIPGIILLLLCGWILLAVYISNKTIDKLDNWGRGVVDTGRQVTDKIMHRPNHDAEAIEDEDDEQEDSEEKEEEMDEEGFVAVDDQDFVENQVPFNDFEVTIPTEEQIESDITKEEHDFEVTEMAEEECIETETMVLGAGGVVDGDDVEKASYEDPEAEDIDDIELYDPLKELSSYRKPAIEGILLDRDSEVQVTETELKENKEQIVQTLRTFGIKIDKIKATIGPTITLYEIVPAAGVKIARIKGLEQDIALSLKAMGIRIIAPMPGKGTIGIEVPNKERQTVSMYSVVKSLRFQESTAELPIALGKNIQNETVVVDLAKLPHLLVAGATGQGKSVGLNVIISSLLYKKHPAELKFVMVDPKKVELSMYAKLEKHFLAKMESEDEAIMTDTQKVIYTLNSLITEMEARYELLRSAQVKKVSEYNKKFTERRLNPRKGHRYLPYIILVIDEFCDMIMTAGKEVEQPITRLAQLAR